MAKKYVSPELAVCELESQDVVTASVGVSWNSKWNDSWGSWENGEFSIGGEQS